MPAKIIRDKMLSKHGLSRFARSSISRDGKSIVFEYPSGARYRVTLEYLLSWFREPHEQRAPIDTSDPRIMRSRRFSDSHLVAVYLSDGRVFYVAFDTVLMACEPRYEYFGGLTEESKKKTAEWWQRHASEDPRLGR